MQNNPKNDNGFLVLIFLSLFAFCIAYYILFFVNISVADTKSAIAVGKTNCYDHVVIIVYAIALGILGMYSAHNSLEIYKRKESFDKDLRNIMTKHQELFSKYEGDIHRNIGQFKDLGVELKEKHLEAISKREDSIKEKINALREEMQGVSNGLKVDIQKDMSELMVKYNNVKKSLDDSIEYMRELKSEMDVLHYSGILNKYISDLNDVDDNAMIAAFGWYTQNGREVDIEVLQKVLMIIPSENNELYRACENVINVIKYQIKNR